MPVRLPAIHSSLKSLPMTEPQDPPRPEQKAAGAAQGSTKKDRLAASLRENLRRRKAQIRGRRALPRDSQRRTAEEAADL